MARLSAVKADITTLDVDAIVNAANETLLGGGGVDGAIHDAAGPELLEACRAIPELRPGVRCPAGHARITPGFKLPARFVIHTVGPRWRDGRHGEPDLLRACYRSCIDLALAHDVRSIAFPAISTGVFGFPAEAASRIAASECQAALDAQPSLERILLVGYSGSDFQILRSAVAAASGI